jgi:hypothetical protein
MIIYLPTTSSMSDDPRWMYDAWKKSGVYTDEWWDKTKDFIECAFALASTEKIRCQGVKCQSTRYFDNVTLTKYLVQNEFISNYET